jgi:1-piperideine-2-carboxylate/1-pyrroline-2-carboxylate reductase [NAD(P)H]
VKILNAAETAHALPYDKLVPALRQAVLELANRQISAPERQVTAIDSDSVLLGMPAVGQDIGITKVITVHANNARHGLAAIQGEVIVFDARNGKRLALLDGPTVTARRTAAMTLLGIDTLAPNKPSCVMLIGTGVQAQAHADALVAYYDITSLHVAARDSVKAQAFCAGLRQRHPQLNTKGMAAATLADAMADIEVLISLTTSRTPVIPEDIPAHVLAVGVGAFKPDMAEFPEALLQRRQIVVDDLAGAQHEAGDLIRANVDWRRVKPLADYLQQGIAVARSGPLPLLKTVGQGAWDLAAARVVLASL